MPNISTVPPVIETPAADSRSALAHFQDHLRYETDCWDVNASLDRSGHDFVLLDVRSPDDFARGHVPTAVNIPHRAITERALAKYPRDMLFVVYCAGPHCNGADKAARRLAEEGRPVKKMIGGVWGWKDDGFTWVTDGRIVR